MKITIIGWAFKCSVSTVSLDHFLYVPGTGELNIWPMDGSIVKDGSNLNIPIPVNYALIL